MSQESHQHTHALHLYIPIVLTPTCCPTVIDRDQAGISTSETEVAANAGVRDASVLAGAVASGVVVHRCTLCGDASSSDQRALRCETCPSQGRLEAFGGDDEDPFLGEGINIFPTAAGIGKTLRPVPPTLKGDQEGGPRKAADY